jgi:hypothetical protein
MTIRHPDNSPPLQLVTRAYAWIILFVLIILYFNVGTVYRSPDFSFNILQIFGSDQ